MANGQKKTAIALTAICLLLGQAQGIAYSHADLAELENKFFFHEYKNETADARLERLEKLVFGEAGSGSESARLQRLKAAVRGGATNDIAGLPSPPSPIAQAPAHSTQKIASAGANRNASRSRSADDSDRYAEIYTPSPSGADYRSLSPKQSYGSSPLHGTYGSSPSSSDRSYRSPEVASSPYGSSSSSSDRSYRSPEAASSPYGSRLSTTSSRRGIGKPRSAKIAFAKPQQPTIAKPPGNALKQAQQREEIERRIAAFENSGPTGVIGELASMEQRILGRTHRNEPLMRRVERLEKALHVKSVQSDPLILRFTHVRDAAQSSNIASSNSFPTAQAGTGAENAAYSSSQAPRTGYSSSQAPRTGYSSSQAPRTGYSSLSAPRAPYGKAPAPQQATTYYGKSRSATPQVATNGGARKNVDYAPAVARANGKAPYAPKLANSAASYVPGMANSAASYAPGMTNNYSSAPAVAPSRAVGPRVAPQFVRRKRNAYGGTSPSVAHGRRAQRGYGAAPHYAYGRNAYSAYGNNPYNAYRGQAAAQKRPAHKTPAANFGRNENLASSSSASTTSNSYYFADAYPEGQTANSDDVNTKRKKRSFFGKIGHMAKKAITAIADF